jgi:hypothetical protein
MGKLTSSELTTDNLKGTQWVGIVEDTNDDLFEGRCRIRVLGKMDQRVDPADPDSDYVLPTEAIPWARPSVASSGGSTSGSGTFSVPKLGTFLRITFDNGNYYSPVYHESIYPSDELKAEIQGSYPNSHVLIYDTAFGLTGGGNEEVTNEREGESIKVFFTEEKGLMMDYTTATGPTTVNIKPDNSVEIINANGDSIVMLNDGNITFTHSAKLVINTTDNTEINCKDIKVKCENADVTASTKAIIDSPKIELGRGATESVIKGDAFAQIFDNHIHPTPAGPSSKPVQSMKPTLSKVSTTK